MNGNCASHTAIRKLELGKESEEYGFYHVYTVVRISKGMVQYTVRWKVMRKHAKLLYLLFRRLFQLTIVSLDCI